jgi:hypothetical protein
MGGKRAGRDSHASARGGWLRMTEMGEKGWWVFTHPHQMLRSPCATPFANSSMTAILRIAWEKKG